MEVRKPDFAGSWYPGNKPDCLAVIEEFSHSATPCPGEGEGAKTIGCIVPHAGWFYSGSIAFNAIKCLNQDPPPDTCLIFGRHLHPGSRNYIMKGGRWATPLGELEIDAQLAEKLTGEFSFVIETASRHEQDNTIELQLPFIKHFFPEIKILPVGVPPAPGTLEIAVRAAEISMALGRCSIVVGSTDLTHYGFNYGYTPKGTGEDAVNWVREVNDKRIVDLMIRMEAEEVIKESLRSRNACCAGAAGASIVAAAALGAQRGEKIIYSTSYDTRPDSSFVGYVGIVFQS